MAYTILGVPVWPEKSFDQIVSPMQKIVKNLDAFAAREAAKAEKHDRSVEKAKSAASNARQNVTKAERQSKKLADLFVID